MKTEINYQKQGADFLKETGTKFDAEFLKYDFHFDGDKEKRDIYRITLRRGRKIYRFAFGQSIVDSGRNSVVPSAYDVLTCLQKSDPGTFENFCADFGYDTDSRKAEKTYHAVVKEWRGISSLYSSAELQKMQEIA